MSAIEVRNISKSYGGTRVVDDVSFTVRQGTVTGFLGPNGAGKTTTLRCLLGLTSPDIGEGLLNGHRYAQLASPLQEVGAVLDATHLHPGRRARSHLQILCDAAGIPGSRAEAVLEEVGLSEAATKRIVGFSLGMRQRLSLAGALLGNPRILILDEPANGLDPQGIEWLRGFLRHQAHSRGVAVLVSSHVLAEVEQSADDVVIISQGRLVRQGTLADITEGSENLHDAFLRLTSDQSASPTDAPRRIR